MPPEKRLWPSPPRVARKPSMRFKRAWTQPPTRGSDPWFRSVLLSAIALTRQDAAMEFLLDLVKSESPDAERAIEAVVRSMPPQEVIRRLESLVKSNPRLASAFATQRSSRL